MFANARIVVASILTLKATLVFTQTSMSNYTSSKCGIDRECVRAPKQDCVMDATHENPCVSMVTWQPDTDQEYVNMELIRVLVSNTQSAYITLGISADQKMGLDAVVGCIFDPTRNSLAVEIGITGPIPGAIADRILIQHKHLGQQPPTGNFYNVGGSIIDNYLICRFRMKLSLNYAQLGGIFDLSKPSYIMQAVGVHYQGECQQHSGINSSIFYPTVTSEQYQLSVLSFQDADGGVTQTKPSDVVTTTQESSTLAPTSPTTSDMVLNSLSTTTTATPATKTTSTTITTPTTTRTPTTTTTLNEATTIDTITSQETSTSAAFSTAQPTPQIVSEIPTMSTVPPETTSETGTPSVTLSTVGSTAEETTSNMITTWAPTTEAIKSQEPMDTTSSTTSEVTTELHTTSTISATQEPIATTRQLIESITTTTPEIETTTRMSTTVPISTTDTPITTTMEPITTENSTFSSVMPSTTSRLMITSTESVQTPVPTSTILTTVPDTATTRQDCEAVLVKANVSPRAVDILGTPSAVSRLEDCENVCQRKGCAAFSIGKDNSFMYGIMQACFTYSEEAYDEAKLVDTAGTGKSSLYRIENCDYNVKTQLVTTPNPSPQTITPVQVEAMCTRSKLSDSVQVTMSMVFKTEISWTIEKCVASCMAQRRTDPDNCVAFAFGKDMAYFRGIMTGCFMYAATNYDETKLMQNKGSLPLYKMACQTIPPRTTEMPSPIKTTETPTTTTTKMSTTTTTEVPTTPTTTEIPTTTTATEKTSTTTTANTTTTTTSANPTTTTTTANPTTTTTTANPTTATTTANPTTSKTTANPTTTTTTANPTTTTTTANPTTTTTTANPTTTTTTANPTTTTTIANPTSRTTTANPTTTPTTSNPTTTKTKSNPTTTTTTSNPTTTTTKSNPTTTTTKSNPTTTTTTTFSTTTDAPTSATQSVVMILEPDSDADNLKSKTTTTTTSPSTTTRKGATFQELIDGFRKGIQGRTNPANVRASVDALLARMRGK